VRAVVRVFFVVSMTARSRAPVWPRRADGMEPVWTPTRIR